MIIVDEGEALVEFIGKTKISHW